MYSWYVKRFLMYPLISFKGRLRVHGKGAQVGERRFGYRVSAGDAYTRASLVNGGCTARSGEYYHQAQDG